MSDTPRTDDFLAHRGYDGIEQFTRGMERENVKMRELLHDVLLGTVPAGAYPDGPCLERWLRDEIKAFMANKPSGEPPTGRL